MEVCENENKENAIGIIFVNEDFISLFVVDEIDAEA